MALYSIKQETLTDIADALRSKYGETKWIGPENNIFKSNNATGFETLNGEIFSPVVKDITQTIEFNEETEIKIKYWASVNIKLAYCIGDYDKSKLTYFVDLSGGSGEIYITGKTITLYGYGNTSTNTVGYYVEVSNAIPRTYTSSEMAAAIEPLDFIPEEAFVISGDCEYRFANNGWNWYLNQYGNRIATNNVSSSDGMFSGSSNITQIPFSINYNSTYTFHNTDYMFSECSNLLNIPILNGMIVYNTNNMFKMCYRLREIPDEIASTWDWGYLEKQTSGYTGNQSWMFNYCYSLRSISNNIIKSGNPYVNYSYNYFYYGFQYCSSLDELIDLPIPYTKATWTYNAFNNTFGVCGRIKNITFAKQKDGTPIIVTWKSQVIDLTNYVGYVGIYRAGILNYNSGITADKEVTDDATYQALKNDPDWFTEKVEYSRYNHDSAVATINSLPDTSAYLATAGGTNTIKFRGAAGSATDGGAINTLTEEEIAVAAAKGWTVSLV